ncbi:hypothetical protein D770_11845 [Flammeovirgaceae bacterium 311]|nr:hypothetical protein D770_11845 [Flammeovirgaceae bacterium 311]
MRKKSNTKPLLHVLLYLLMVLVPLFAFAQPDSTSAALREPQWEERYFSAEKLQELQEDDRLVYEIEVAEDDSWGRIKRWFFTKLSQLFGGASSSGLLDGMVYVVCIGAGIFIIFRFLDVDLTSLVQRRAVAPSIGVNEGITENIHALDFEKEIGSAVEQQEFKRAVRLLYLASLKRLADAGLIRFEPGKTNRQYQRELRSPQCSSRFASLGHVFEYAWYGDFPVNEQLYQQAEQEYRELSKLVEVRV